MNIDMVNGVFESLGAAFILLSVCKLAKEKLVRGISYWHISFFMVWGFWNLYYYPQLGQWFSVLGGALLVASNMVYVVQLIYYTYNERGWIYMWKQDPPKDYYE